MKRPSLLPGLLGALALCPAGAYAQTQTPPEAQTRFQRGMDLFNARNFEGALAEFQRSYELSGQVELLYNLGRAYQAVGRYPEAARAIEDYLRRATDLPPARRAEVEGFLTQMRDAIAHLDVTVSPAAARAALLLDGEEIPETQRGSSLAVGPGRHTLEARAAGYQSSTSSVVVASGDRRAVSLTLSPVPETRVVTRVVEVRVPAAPPAAAPVRPAPRGIAPVWFVATASATGAFLLAGAVFGALTASAHDDYVGFTRDQYDRPDVAAVRDRGETMRLLANVSFGLAAAAGVATIVCLTQTRFRRAPAADVAVAPLPGGAAARLLVRF